MKKIDSLCRLILPCFCSSPTASSSSSAPTSTTATKKRLSASAPTSTTATKKRLSASAPTSTTATKKRLSASLKDDIQEDQYKKREESSTAITDTDEEEEEEVEESVNNDHHVHVPARPSKSMVIGTLYGRRRGHVCFCIQHDRLSSRPSFLLELSMPTHLLVKEMQCGVLRIAFKCDRPDMRNCPLQSIPMWTIYCNGRKVGFAVRRRATNKDRRILKIMQLISFGVGVIPTDTTQEKENEKEKEKEKEDGEVMYMRASYERVVGSSDMESFHLLNPDGCSDQDLSIFLIR